MASGHPERALGSPLFPLSRGWFPPLLLLSLEQLNVTLTPSPTRGHQSYKGLEMQVEPLARVNLIWAPWLLWAPDYQGAASWAELHFPGTPLSASPCSSPKPIQQIIFLQGNWALWALYTRLWKMPHFFFSFLFFLIINVTNSFRLYSSSLLYTMKMWNNLTNLSLLARQEISASTCAGLWWEIGARKYLTVE